MNIRFHQAREMLEFIKPYDYERALQNLDFADMQSLWRWADRNRNLWDWGVYEILERGSHDHRLVGEPLNILDRTFRAHPEKYWEFLTEMNIIPLPPLMKEQRYLSLRQAEEMLTPVWGEPSGIVFGLGNRYNNEEYKNSIGILQQSLGLVPTGEYDKETAEAAYLAKGRYIPTGQGYLDHEVNPDILFDPWYKCPKVCVVNREVWHQMGLDGNDLAPDGSEYWQQGPPRVFGVMSDIYGGVENAKFFCGNVFKRSEQGNAIKIETYHKTSSIFDIFVKVFNIADTAEEMLQEGVYDPDAIVTEVVITGIEEVITDKLAEKAVKFTLQLFLKGSPGGIVYGVTVFLLDEFFGDVFDNAVERVENFFREEFLSLMDRAGEYLQARHEEDMAAGIRMD